MTRLLGYFRDQADERRVTRVWSALDARLSRTRQLHRAVAVAYAGLAAGAVAALAVFVPSALRDPPSAPAVATPAPHVLQLADGSRVEHAAAARVEVQAVTAELVELQMTRGRAEFRVTPNPRRAFLTHAGGYTIRVVGTEFAVSLEASGVQVAVTRGEVEVRRDQSDELWRVRAGEQWASSSARSAAVTEAAAREATVTEAAAREAAAATEAAPAPPTVPLPAAVRIPPAKPKRPDAAQLFRLAQQARLDGQIAASESLLAELLERFPSDSRAGLAAFQLGRTRLELGDAKGALAALDRAASGGSAFQEQVEARRVQALEQLGDREGCRDAREKFLREFPSGSFADLVRQRCP